MCRAINKTRTASPALSRGVTKEIDARMADDRRLLATSPSLDMLYPLKLGWRSFGVSFSVIRSCADSAGHKFGGATRTAR